MHPQGSTDILLAAGDGLHPSFAFLHSMLVYFSSAHRLFIALTSFIWEKQKISSWHSF